MRLTLHTDYALRVLMYVGTKGEALATIGEIAERFGISANHLMKVVHQLARAGYLETVRGKNGGLRLGRPAAAINLGQVVRLTEEELAVVGCLEQAGYCRIEHACELRHILGEAMGAFLAVIDRYTLADLLQPRQELAWLLQIGAPGRQPPAPPSAA